MQSRHDYGREAAGRARLRFNRRHPLLSAKESPNRKEKEPDNEVKSVDPGEHNPLKRTSSTSIETAKSFGVGSSEDNLNEYLEVHVPNEIKCGMLYPHQMHIERVMTDLTCTTASMSTFDSGEDTKLAGEDNNLDFYSQSNELQMKMYHASEANVLTTKSYTPRHMQDCWTINESDKSRMIPTQHIPTGNSSHHQHDHENILREGALVKFPSESECDTYDDDDDDDDDDEYDDNDCYDSVSLMESRTHSYQRTISGMSKNKKLSLISGIGVEVGSDFKCEQLSSPSNVSCSLMSTIGDVILGFTQSPTNDTTPRTCPFDMIVTTPRTSPFDTIRKFMCNPSRVLYSGSEQDNRNANLSAAVDEASADEWSIELNQNCWESVSFAGRMFLTGSEVDAWNIPLVPSESRGESDDDESTEFRALFSK